MAYTEFPEVDIKTHRSLAKWNRRFGFVIAAGGFYYYAAIETEPWVLSLVIAVVALVLLGSSEMRIQALEWELEESDSVRESDTGGR